MTIAPWLAFASKFDLEGKTLHPSAGYFILPEKELNSVSAQHYSGQLLTFINQNQNIPDVLNVCWARAFPGLSMLAKKLSSRTQANNDAHKGNNILLGLIKCIKSFS